MSDVILELAVKVLVPLRRSSPCRVFAVRSYRTPIELTPELQTQLLACLKWLSDFQILAFVPAHDKISFSGVAELADVPAAELSRVVRLTCTAGILREPELGFVAHSPLSAQFAKKPSLLDAIGALAETLAPAALGMSEATRLRKQGKLPRCEGLTARRENEPRLQRQLGALERLTAGGATESLLAAVSLMDWPPPGPGSVVEVNAPSLASAAALLERHPQLLITVQLRDDRAQLAGPRDGLLTSNATVQRRTPGAAQTVRDASVYIIHLPTAPLTASPTPLLPQIGAELRAHFAILRNNPSAQLILLIHLLPGPGMTDADIEATARVQDLWQLQTGSAPPMEESQLMELVAQVRDSRCRLAITRKLSSRRHLTAAFEARLQLLADPSGSVIR